MSDVCALIEFSPQAAANPKSLAIASRPASRRPKAGPGMLRAMLDVTGVARGGLLSRDRSAGPIEMQLRTLCADIVDRFTDCAQTIRIEIAVDGICPAALERTISRIVRHSVRDAVQYSMRLRLVGRVCVHVLTRDGMTVLTISHDGWDCRDHSCASGTRHCAEQLAQRHAGRVMLYRGHMTTMQVELRHGP